MNRELKEKVQNLRKKGYTYSEINKELKSRLSKSTISNWCENVVFSRNGEEKHKRKLKELNKKAREAAVKANYRKRKEFLEKLKSDNDYLKEIIWNKDVAKIALAMLYLGEGAKGRQPGRIPTLGNSDPEVIEIYIRLLEKCYGVKRKYLKARISYRVDQDIKELTNFWSKKVSIPKKNFYKTKPDPRTKGKKTKNKDYKGVCVIYCSGTNIRVELDIIARMFL
jgi:hypothetical protein